MAFTDKDRDEILAKISKKIESSSVLNGGFDRLVASVETIKDKQGEHTEKLDQINLRLYEPKDGLFSRIQQVENDVSKIHEHLEHHNKNDDENFDKLNKHLEKIELLRKTADDTQGITKRLQRISGEDLTDLEKAVDLNKKIATLYWALIALILTGFGNFIWQIFVTHAATHR